MAKQRPKKIGWEEILAYTPYIAKICTEKIPEVNNKDESIGIEDLVQEVLLHCYNHRDRYDPKRGGVGTFIRIKTRQQIFKMNSKGNTLRKNKEKWETDEKRRLWQEDLDNEKFYTYF